MKNKKAKNKIVKDENKHSKNNFLENKIAQPKISFCSQNLNQISADFEVILIVDKNLKHKFVKDADKFAFFDYKGEGVLNLVESKKLYIGIKDLKPESLRLATAKAIQILAKFDIKSIRIASYFDEDLEFSFMAMIEGFLLGNYKFEKYKTKKKPCKIEEIKISKENYKDLEFDESIAIMGLRKGQIIANSTNAVKDIVNEIPQVYTPLKFAEDALKFAKISDNVKCEVYDEKYLKKQGMNAFLAVNQAGGYPPRLIHLSYKPAGEIKQKIVFVGKGLTYDSGGLSLKPANYMETMKSDKAGAAAAFGIIKAVSELNLPFEVHSVLGATENMIGNKAYKPDDILIAKNKVSIEIKNTDAEGRLVLADCLCWAQDELEPDLLIDMATLTGACVVGLGEYTSGIMGNNFDLQTKFKKLSQDSGELLSILEFNDYLKELIKSDIADVSNCASSRYGGALTAGLFLDKFIKKEYKDKWLHLDIAGPAFATKPWGENAAGASGAGLRANIYYMLNLMKNKGN